jgi:ribosomal protein S27AE
MDSFDLVANVEDFFLSISEEQSSTEQIDYSTCPTCAVHMSVRNNRYMCEGCGHMDESVEVSDFVCITSDNSYNVISTGVRCVGTNAYRYQSILRANSNSSESNRETLLNNVLFGVNRMIKNANPIPKEVLLAVADQYRHLCLSGTIARGTIFRAMLASLTYYESLKQKVSFKPSDIYQKFDIDPSTYSKGDKKIREALDYGHLDIDIRSINAEESYIFTYAASLEFSDAHTEALLELLQFVIAQRIINPNAKSSTRALAVLSFFITATKYGMSSTAFEEHFKCNFGSVRTLALDMIQKFDQIRPIFQQRGIKYDGINMQTKRVIKRKVKKGSRIALD